MNTLLDNIYGQYSGKNDYWRTVRTKILDFAQTYFAQNGMWSLTFTRLGFRAGYSGFALLQFFPNQATFDAAYLTHRSGLSVEAQRLVAAERSCLAAWAACQRDAKFDINE